MNQYRKFARAIINAHSAVYHPVKPTESPVTWAYRIRWIRAAYTSHQKLGEAELGAKRRSSRSEV